MVEGPARVPVLEIAELPLRVRRALDRRGICFADELLAAPWWRIQQIRNIGPKAEAQIEAWRLRQGKR